MMFNMNRIVSSIQSRMKYKFRNGDIPLQEIISVTHNQLSHHVGPGYEIRDLLRYDMTQLLAPTPGSVTHISQYQDQDQQVEGFLESCSILTSLLKESCYYSYDFRTSRIYCLLRIFPQASSLYLEFGCLFISCFYQSPNFWLRQIAKRYGTAQVANIINKFFKCFDCGFPKVSISELKSSEFFKNLKSGPASSDG